MRRSSFSAGTISDQSAPICLAHLGQRVGDADRGDQAEVDRDLGELGALVAHRQDRAAEGLEYARKFAGRAAATDRRSRRCSAPGFGGALDGATEHQRLDLVVAPRRLRRRAARA